MALKFWTLEATEASDYPQFMAALDKLHASDNGTAVAAVVPQPQPQPEPQQDALSLLSQQPQPADASPLAPVAAFALPQPQQQGKRGGKRTDGLGMRGHPLDCSCPADIGLRAKLSKLLFNGQGLDAVPAEGSPDAATWAAALAKAEGQAQASVVAPVPEAAPIQQQASPLAQLMQQPQQQPPAASQQVVSFPQQLSEYPSKVYQACVAWATTKAVKFTPPKQQAVLDFLQGNRTLDSLQDVKHKEGTLRDVFVGLIRQALA